MVCKEAVWRIRRRSITKVGTVVGTKETNCWLRVTLPGLSIHVSIDSTVVGDAGASYSSVESSEKLERTQTRHPPEAIASRPKLLKAAGSMHARTPLTLAFVVAAAPGAACVGGDGG